MGTTKAIKKMMGRCIQLLDYLSDHLDMKGKFHVFDMILNIHSNGSYLLEAKACSHARRHFFMGWMPKDGEPIHLNGVFHISTMILHISSLHPQLKQSLAPFTTIVKRALLFDSTHPSRYGPSADKKNGPLQQRHSSGHCEQYNQASVFQI